MLSDAETEVAETQVWLEFAVKCGYLNRDDAVPLYTRYDEIIRTLVGTINHPDTWVIKKPQGDKVPKTEPEI
jgi:four helix bundle protein